MADNIDITPGAGATVATEDVAGVQHQKVKVEFGGDGVATLVSTSDPLPVTATIPAAATSIAKAEDAAHASGDVGVPVLAVRKATPADLSDTDGDYEPLQIKSGRVWASTTVTGTVTVSHSGAIATNLDQAFAADGDASTARHINVGGSDGVNDQTLAVDSTGAVKLAGGTNNIGDVDVLTLPGAYAEDTAHASGDVGHQILTVRSDTPTAKGGTDGDYQPALTDNEGLLWVRPAPKVQRFSVTPTISTSVYASGDVLGGLQTISNAVRKAGGSGTILSILVLDKTQAQRAAMDILIFDRSVTVAADNAAVAMSDADMANCLGVVTVGAYNTAWPGTPLNSISTLINVGLPIVCNGADLYFVPVVRGTPTYTSTSDLIFIFTILQD